MSCGDVSYVWVEDWIKPPPDALCGRGWAHHGLAFTTDGTLVSFQAGGDHVCFFGTHGGLIESWPTGMLEGHGIYVAGSAGHEVLWIADCGVKFVPNGTEGYELESAQHGRVASFGLDGRRLGELTTPALEIYSHKHYRPTGVTVDERPGSVGSIWVADGYGAGLVHRFSADGELELTLSGEEGAGRFDCPHAVLIDDRGAEPCLYVTDRANSRLQVYDLDGVFLRSVSDGLKSPTALAVHGDTLIIAELDACITILDANDRLVGYLGRDEQAPQREGWPNVVADGRTVRPNLEPGRFNSPHGLAVDNAGDIYVAEFVIGGRHTRLRRED